MGVEFTRDEWDEIVEEHNGRLLAERALADRLAGALEEIRARGGTAAIERIAGKALAEHAAARKGEQ